MTCDPPLFVVLYVVSTERSLSVLCFKHDLYKTEAYSVPRYAPFTHVGVGIQMLTYNMRARSFGDPQTHDITMHTLADLPNV